MNAADANAGTGHHPNRVSGYSQETTVIATWIWESNIEFQ
jgi:hypothetical protein